MYSLGATSRRRLYTCRQASHPTPAQQRYLFGKLLDPSSGRRWQAFPEAGGTRLYGRTGEWRPLHGRGPEALLSGEDSLRRDRRSRQELDTERPTPSLEERSFPPSELRPPRRLDPSVPSCAVGRTRITLGPERRRPAHTDRTCASPWRTLLGRSYPSHSLQSLPPPFER